MPEWVNYLLIVAAVGIAGFWVLIIALALILKPKGMSLYQGLLLIPDVVRLVKHLVMERGVASTVKLLLAGLFVYLVSPVDLVPDLLPIVGTVDDVILFIYVLRTFIAKAGPTLVEQHRPGTKKNMDLLYRLLRVSSDQPPQSQPPRPQLPKAH